MTVGNETARCEFSFRRQHDTNELDRTMFCFGPIARDPLPSDGYWLRCCRACAHTHPGGKSSTFR